MAVKSDRLKRDYRLTWVDDSGCTTGVVNPPITPARLAHVMFGGLAGTPVDAFVCTVGMNAGYTLSYPTEVDGMEFVVDRLEAGAVVGSADLWRRIENLRALWSEGHDPVQIALDEAHRLGKDFWLQLRMNDWHHVDEAGEIYRIIGSRFYEEHREYQLGSEGVDGWPESLQQSLRYFQDFAHNDVRRIRLETASEAMARYPQADGWEYDFMRCPGYFAFGKERDSASLITDLILKTREMLDELGSKYGKSYGLSVRVPNTIEGSLRLGLDVPQWIEDHLVDLVVPSTFFVHDTGEDISEWIDLAAGTSVRIHPAIEEAYLTGATQGRDVADHEIRESIMRPLTVEMIRAIAARHWRNGADGLYLFNYPGTPDTYGYDNRPALHDIGSPLRLEYKDKCYVVMRRNGAFPNCLPKDQQIPAELGEEPVRVSLQVADDFQAAGARVARIQLRLLVEELTNLDELAVTMNGNVLVCDNEPEAGRRAPGRKTWLVYDLADSPPMLGVNIVEVRAVRAERLAEEIPLRLSDIELDVSYRYPDGRWRHPSGFDPRT